MFVLVENNSVVLGPNDYNKKKFETVLKEELEIEFTLPTSLNSYLEINSSVQIYPVKYENLPVINSKIEILNGPFWDFSNQTATASYQPLTKPIGSIKSEMTGNLANKRWQKETEGVVVPLQNKLVWVTTQRGERDIFLQAVQLGSNGATWKLTEVEQVAVEIDPSGYRVKGTLWLTLSTAELQQIVGAIVTKVQAAFDWENNYANQIKSATTVQELDAIIF